MKTTFGSVILSILGSIVIAIIIVVLYANFVAPIQCPYDELNYAWSGFACSLTGFALFFFTIIISFVGLLVSLLVKNRTIKVDEKHKYRQTLKIFLITLLLVFLLLIISFFS